MMDDPRIILRFLTPTTDGPSVSLRFAEPAENRKISERLALSSPRGHCDRSFAHSLSSFDQRPARVLPTRFVAARFVVNLSLLSLSLSLSLS